MTDETKAPRKREWTMEHVVEEQVIDGVAWPFQKLRVAFRGYNWCVPDSAAGRADAMALINAIRGRAEVRDALRRTNVRLDRLRDAVAQTAHASVYGDVEAVQQRIRAAQAELTKAMDFCDGTVPDESGDA